MNLSDFDVVLLGCGQMGSALARGAVSAGAIDAGNLQLVDVDSDRVSTLAAATGANPRAPEERNRTVWLVAVKPHDVRHLLARQDIADSDIVISVAAGVTLATIEAAVPSGAPVVRAMPNTPALIGKGVTGIYSVDDEARKVASQLFESVGAVVTLAKESQFDAVTALSGSGPAYVFVAIEALADGGVLMGLDRATALELAIRTVEGAAALAASERAHPAELKDRVASPGGTTIAGLDALEAHGFRGALIAAVRAAAERSRALADS